MSKKLNQITFQVKSYLEPSFAFGLTSFFGFASVLESRPRPRPRECAEEDEDEEEEDPEEDELDPDEDDELEEELDELDDRDLFFFSSSPLLGFALQLNTD